MHQINYAFYFNVSRPDLIKIDFRLRFSLLWKHLNRRAELKI